MQGLYVITPASASCPDRLADAVEKALQGGASVVQFRHKSPDWALKKTLAEATLEVCRRHGVCFLINDSTQLAAEIGADGVHLGQTDGSLIEARAQLGAHAVIGRTCHDSKALMKAAVSEGATYCAFGRLFPSHTKPDASALSLTALADLVTATPCPVVAIGGIDANNAAPVIQTGVSAIAVSGAVFEAPDIRAAAQALATLF